MRISGIISDGDYVPGALAACGFAKGWVERLLREKGLAQKDVFLLTLNRKGRYHLVKRDRKRRKLR